MPFSRDRWFALFATTLGVSAGCNHDGDAPPVTANEVAPLADAASPSTTTDPTTVDASAPTPSATTADMTPDASIATTSAPNASVAPSTDVPPASSNAVKLAWLAPLATPFTMPPSPPKAPPAPSPSLCRPPPAPKPFLYDNHQTTGEALVPCVPIPGVPPKVTVNVQLAPRPGLAAAETSRTTSGIAVTRSRIRACFNDALKLDPTIPSMRMVVHATAPGDGKIAAFTLDAPKLGSAQAIQCVSRALVTALGGDDKPATSTFNVDVAVTE